MKMTPTTPISPCEPLDPRIRRTRELLQQSLAKLLESHPFENISVQDITDAATVNRATFYAHYPDKFALLECLVAARFHALLTHRGIVFDGTCSSALLGIILGVCDYLAQTPFRTPDAACERQRLLEPHLESAVVSVIRRMILDGARAHPSANPISPEMLAAAASWAIYGAAKEWLLTPNRPPSEHAAPTILHLVAPILSSLHPTAAQPPAMATA